MPERKPPRTGSDWAHVALLVAPLVLLVGLGVVSLALTAPVGAQSGDQSTLDRLTNTDGESVVAAIQGRVAGLLADLLDPGAPERTAADACADLRQTFNRHNSSIQSYANARANASTDRDVLRVECVIEDTRASVTLVSDVRNGSWTNATMVSETSREPDVTCRLEDGAARNAASELGTFADKFAVPNATVSPSYLDRVTAQYAGEVKCEGISGVSG